MLDRPRMIWMSGNCVADRADALQRPLAELAVVLVAGGDGEGQRVDQQVATAAGRACCRRSRPAARRCAACPPRVLAMPTSSMVSAITAAPNFLASTRRSAAGSSPSSKLIELMIGLPPCSFSAASITGVSVRVDHQRRVRRWPVKRRITSFISAISSRPTKAVQMSSALRAFARPARGPWRRSRPSRRLPAARATSWSRWRCSARRWRR